MYTSNVSDKIHKQFKLSRFNEIKVKCFQWTSNQSLINFQPFVFAVYNGQIYL